MAMNHLKAGAIVPTPIATVLQESKRQKPPDAVHVAKRPVTKWELGVQVTLCSCISGFLVVVSTLGMMLEKSVRWTDMIVYLRAGGI
ncbi:hypothetical protein K7X08_029273 [Anisodus acutangulus]|uniref:Uncharacterized protein n=1 Tax=Anisodus acutangulus TaxID=402998 RepID=A0A9Q1L4A7_9SOLA|nr:hypothetical protein K7X08_029273 [Anisodus acutangulus]